MISKMKNLYILPVVAAGLIFTGCSKENGFDNAEGEGQFLKSALSMDINADALMQTRAASGLNVNVDDFNVIFTKDGQSEPTCKFRYGDMSDVVTLPAGTYTVTATYGENRQAEWDCPYFLGKSESFDVNAYEITSYIDPVVCRLENIKVTVDFDQSLRNAMSDDSYVEVKVGGSSALNFGLAEADAQKGGFFMHSEEISLVATFYGSVDGQYTVESKSLKNISKGNHYKITFKLHTGTGSDPTGGLTGDITTDAEVTVVDVTTNVEIGDEPLIEGNDRPQEGDDPDDPNEPSTPDDPQPKAPEITADEPVNLDIINDVNDLTSCVLHIKSFAEGGIQQFECVIDSETLTPSELEQVGLSSVLNLAETPDSYRDALAGLGLDVNVKGWSEVTFDISTFMGLLASLGNGQADFILNVTDANGTTSKTLKIKL